MYTDRQIVFSIHALVRCFQRNITGEQIAAVLARGKLKYETRESNVYARGKLWVVVSRKTGFVVTAFRRSAEKNPKRIFRKNRRERDKRKWGNAKIMDLRRKQSAKDAIDSRRCAREGGR